MAPSVVASCSSFDFDGYSVPSIVMHGGDRIRIGLKTDPFRFALAFKSRLKLRKDVRVSVADAHPVEGQAAEWIVRQTGISFLRAIDRLQDAGIVGNPDTHAFGFSHRYLIALVAAAIRRPHLIIYHTSGADPRGAAMIDDYMAAQPPDTAVVKIVKPHVLNSGVVWETLRDSTFIQIVPDEAIIASHLESGIDSVIEMFEAALKAARNRHDDHGIETD